MQAAAQAQAGDAPGCRVGAIEVVMVQPNHPPGLRSRKARRYGDQIRTLRAEGYTLDDIREALAAAGVVVSKSTVQREASRQPPPTDRSNRRNRDSPPVVRVGEDPISELKSHALLPPEARHRSGKDVAEEFRRSHINNPLLRAKEQR